MYNLVKLDTYPILLLFCNMATIFRMSDNQEKFPFVYNAFRGITVGLLTGLFIMVFANTIHFVSKLNAKYTYLFLLLPVGAVATHYIYRIFGSNFKKATVYAIDQIHSQEEKKALNLATEQKCAHVNPLMGVVGYISASISHLLGASVGKEGVGVQIGLSAGAILDSTENRIAKALKLKDTDTTAYYMMSGASAAFGSLFGSPIAGTLFGLQFASPDIVRLDAIIPCTLSSFAATLVTTALKTHIMVIPEYAPLQFNINNMLWVIAFSLIAGFVVRFFCIALEESKELGERCYGHLPQWITKTIPATVLAAITFIYFKLSGNLDYNGLATGLLYSSISGDVDWYAFILKALLILLSMNAGFIGGEVVPLLVFGSTFGYTFASIFSLPAPAFASLGALIMLSGGTNLPLVCFALGLELFHYNEPWLLFIACSLGYVASGKRGIYDHQRNII